MKLILAVTAMALGLTGPILAAPKPAPVVFLGASVVQFWTDEHPDFFAAHPDYVDMGHAGEPPATTIARTEGEVMPLKPAVVLFLTGGNATPERTIHNLDRMAELGRKQKARLSLAGSPSTRPANLAVIRDYAQREGLGYVDFADMRGPDGRVKPGLTYDGVHPTPAGYALMEPPVVAAIDRARAAP